MPQLKSSSILKVNIYFGILIYWVRSLLFQNLTNYYIWEFPTASRDASPSTITNWMNTNGCNEVFHPLAPLSARGLGPGIVWLYRVHSGHDGGGRGPVHVVAHEPGPHYGGGEETRHWLCSPGEGQAGGGVHGAPLPPLLDHPCEGESLVRHDCHGGQHAVCLDIHLAVYSWN